MPWLHRDETQQLEANMIFLNDLIAQTAAATDQQVREVCIALKLGKQSGLLNAWYFN